MDGTALSENQSSDTDHEMLRSFLVDRDAQCPACGYNLRMLNKPVCPECGLSLKLTVGSDTPYKRAWAITLCLNAMVAGAGLFFLLLTIVAGGPPSNDFMEYLWYFGPMAWIPVPLILFGVRKWFCRSSTTVQYIMLALSLCWLCLLGAALLLTFD